MMSPSAPRRGRPPGDQNTRARVLAAARQTFTERGYDAASLRHIARVAGVDAGMVRHYFVDKAGLFRAAMDLPIDPGAVLSSLLSEGLESLGERLLRQFIAEWDRPGNASGMIILIRSAMTHDEATRMLREFISSQVLGRIAGAVDASDGALRASLIGSQIVGLVVARYIVRVEPLASADPETVVAAVAPTVQRYLTGSIH
ncbi:MAG TPA: TetR family transcriptional regulator [Microbacterium sp.]|nr:TetR family transcriptional regulator [Microbacterium sp.]